VPRPRGGGGEEDGSFPTLTTPNGDGLVGCEGRGGNGQGKWVARVLAFFPDPLRPRFVHGGPGWVLSASSSMALIETESIGTLVSRAILTPSLPQNCRNYTTIVERQSIGLEDGAGGGEGRGGVTPPGHGGDWGYA